MRLALIQMSSDADDTAGNVAKACDYIDEAAKPESTEGHRWTA